MMEYGSCRDMRFVLTEAAVWYYHKHQKEQKGVHTNQSGVAAQKCDESNQK